VGAGGMGGPSPLSMSSEKIYPADQPMVFNPQNPNAPPIYPCGICHKEVHDNDQVSFTIVVDPDPVGSVPILLALLDPDPDPYIIYVRIRIWEL